MPRIYKLIAVLVVLIAAALTPGCSTILDTLKHPLTEKERIAKEKAAEEPPSVAEESIVEEKTVVEPMPEVKESVIEDKAVEEPPPPVEESIAEEQPKDADETPAVPEEVKESIVEEKAATEEQPKNAGKTPAEPVAPPQDMDGATPNTSLSLPLNGRTGDNSLNYGANDKVDWWRIEVPASGALTVNCEPSSDLKMELHEFDVMTQIAKLSSSADRVQISAELAAAGTYYVKVYVDRPGSAPSYMLHTSYTDMNFLQGFKSYDEGEYEKCIEHLETALRSPWTIRSGSRSDLLKARLYLGVAYIAKNWKDKASEQFKAVLNVDPGYKLDPGYFSPKIIEVFEASRIDLLKAHLDLGISYVAKNLRGEAIEQFKAVLRIEPSYTLDPDNFSPKIIDAFEEARQMINE